MYQAYYNWAIAISDRAKMRGRTKEAEELWKQVEHFKYSVYDASRFHCLTDKSFVFIVNTGLNASFCSLD